MSSTERPALADVITDAITYAASAGFDVRDITADDFALQRSPEGWSHATYVDGDFVIAATIGPDGEASTDVGYIEWIGSPEDDGDEAETDGDEDEDDGMVRVYLPGDAPADATPPTPEQIDTALHTVAVRDERGIIRRRRDGLYIAAENVTAEQLEVAIATLFPGDSRRERSHRELYQLAIDLIRTEAADATAVDAAEREFVAGIAERLDLDAGLTAIIGPNDEAVSVDA